MKWKLPISLAAAALVFASGCVPSQVEGTFVSGHLGNYAECPGDGYSPTSDDASRSAPANFDADYSGACAEGSDCNFGPLNCEDAQATIRLDNLGADTVAGLNIERIELLDPRGRVVAELPLISIAAMEAGTVFDGDIDAGEELDLRIDFQGPTSVSAFMKSEDGARIRIVFQADAHPPITIDSDELYTLPSVVT